MRGFRTREASKHDHLLLQARQLPDPDSIAPRYGWSAAHQICEVAFRDRKLGQAAFRRRLNHFSRGHCLVGLAFASGNLDSKAALRNR